MGGVVLKILYIITLPDLGGAQVHLLTVAAEMTARGHGVSVIVGHEGWLTERLQAAVVRCPAAGDGGSLCAAEISGGYFKGIGHLAKR